MALVYPLDADMAQDTPPTLHKSTLLYSLVIKLGAAQQGYIPQTLGRAIHAQVMSWFSRGNSEIANTVHNLQTSPISLSGLVGKRNKSGTKPDDNFTFRIGLLDGDLLAPLLAGLEEWDNKSVPLGKFLFVLKSFEVLPGNHRNARVSDYQLLSKAIADAEDITLRFLSPTSFKQGKIIQPFPLPDLVFGSLLRRWNAFAPEDLHFPKIEWQGMVSAFDLRTATLRLEGGPEIGSQGWVKYRFPDPEQARIATILAHFAFFAGVGRKTAMGMGQAHLVDSK